MHTVSNECSQSHHAHTLTHSYNGRQRHAFVRIGNSLCRRVKIKRITSCTTIAICIGMPYAQKLREIFKHVHCKCSVALCFGCFKSVLVIYSQTCNTSSSSSSISLHSIETSFFGGLWLEFQMDRNVFDSQPFSRSVFTHTHAHPAYEKCQAFLFVLLCYFCCCSVLFLF